MSDYPETFAFYTTAYCPACKVVWPIVERVAAEIGAGVEYVDLSEEMPDSRSRDITAVPTIRVFDEDDNLLREIRGGRPSEREIRALFTNE
ncbi:thioredoxin domain-containing protein [Streptomyces sp. NPDC002644]